MTKIDIIVKIIYLTYLQQKIFTVHITYQCFFFFFFLNLFTTKNLYGTYLQQKIA